MWPADGHTCDLSTFRLARAGEVFTRSGVYVVQLKGRKKAKVRDWGSLERGRSRFLSMIVVRSGKPLVTREDQFPISPFISGSHNIGRAYTHFHVGLRNV